MFKIIFMKIANKIIPLGIVLGSLFMYSCGGGNSEAEEGEAPKSMVDETSVDPMEDKGIGPISSISLDAEINAEMASSGEGVYNAKCTACHKVDGNYIGPSPSGILGRRTPEWIMNMILNPEEMVQKNTIAKKLLIEYKGAPMANQNLTEEEARSVLEYFRTL